MQRLGRIFFKSTGEGRRGEPLAAEPVSPTEMAMDTIAEILRILGQFPLEQETLSPQAFTAMCEQWAQHVSLATPPPTAGPDGQPSPAPTDARRDWTGVREFVRGYCRGSVTHTRQVLGDLRQVVWVFIQNLHHAFAQDQQADTEVRARLAHLAELAERSSTTELKREVLTTVVSLHEALEQRRRAQQARMEDLGARVRSLGQELEAARRESETDPLTQLFNRKAFDAYAARTLELVKAFGHTSCLLLIDTDSFKSINDSHGHTTGDEVLRRVADAMSRLFLRKNDFVARYGGDEMAVVLRETKADEAVGLADRLLRAVRSAALERTGGIVKVSVSIGIAEVRPEDDLKTWIDRADRALYEAKQAGRDRYVLA
jgi:diguanylate cyclase